jgi:hypothetical protein
MAANKAHKSNTLKRFIRAVMAPRMGWIGPVFVRTLGEPPSKKCSESSLRVGDSRVQRKITRIERDARRLDNPNSKPHKICCAAT